VSRAPARSTFRAAADILAPMEQTHLITERIDDQLESRLIAIVRQYIAIVRKYSDEVIVQRRKAASAA
jgi:hypothetical protein